VQCSYFIQDKVLYAMRSIPIETSPQADFYPNNYVAMKG